MIPARSAVTLLATLAIASCSLLPSFGDPAPRNQASGSPASPLTDAAVRPVCAPRGADLLQRDIGAALGEAHGAAIALAGDGVARRRVQVLELHAAAELRRHRADLHGDLRLELVVPDPLDGLAAGDGGLQDLRIVQGFPDSLARRGDAPLAGHFHGRLPRLRRTLVAGGEEGNPRAPGRPGPPRMMGEAWERSHGAIGAMPACTGGDGGLAAV